MIALWINGSFFFDELDVGGQRPALTLRAEPLLKGPNHSTHQLINQSTHQLFPKQICKRIVKRGLL
jgi:hypothetical protein